MTKQEIFNNIIKVCADVCNVDVKDILEGTRKEDVVTARTLTILWADAAGFTVESIIHCMGVNNANSVNSVKARIEEFWRDRFAFHVLVIESGVRLREIAKSIGTDFELNNIIRRYSKRTGKY